MATRDTGQPAASGITRRDFLKVGAAATAVAGCGLEFAYDPDKALAYEGTTDYQVTATTCPYCSASCGQRVVVDKRSTSATFNEVVDIYGDFESPWNSGGLCAKGAGSLQLVNNKRRIGAYPAADGVHPEGAVFNADPAFDDGIAYFHNGDGVWSKVPLDTALADIGTELLAARGALATTASTVSVLAATDAAPKVLTVNVNGTDVSRTYYGFGGLSVVARVDGKYNVLVNGTKQDHATLAATLGTSDPVQILAAFDTLVFEGVSSPNKAAEYGTITPKAADLGSKLWAAGVLGNNADLVRDGSTYYAYVADPTGALSLATSADMVTWTYRGALGKPGNMAGLKNLHIRKSGTALKIYSNGFTAGPVEDNRVYYSTLSYTIDASGNVTGTTWADATLVTFAGATPAVGSYYGHPFAVFDGVTCALYVNRGGGSPVEVAYSHFTAPTAFDAPKAITTPALSHGNVFAAATFAMYTEYVVASDPLGYAFSDIKAFNAPTYNSKNVAFFGSSHINNEQNYMYRKIIANFGTSNVEHQARI